MYIDYKVITWNRVHFSDDADPKKIIKIIQEKGIDSIFSDDLGFVEQGYLYEAEEKVTVDENGGFSTIEVYENNNPVDDLVWSNGKD